MTGRVPAAVVGAGVMLALALGPDAGLAGQELQYNGSVGYATGSYTFTERTSSISILNGLSLVGGRWSVSASLPVIIQNSGDVSYIGGTRVPTGMGRDGGGMGGHGSMVEGTAGGYEAVLGDPVARASFAPVRGFGTLRSIELQAMVKAPVADTSSGVGTGRWDVGAGASVGMGVGGTFLFADASVWSPGDLPDLELRPYASVALGAGHSLGDRWSGLVSLTVSSPVIDGIDAPASVGGGLSYRIGEGRSLSLGATAGLTDTAPDLSIYLGWSASP